MKLINHIQSYGLNFTYVTLLMGALLLQSCFKEKPLAPPPNQSIGQTALISMGPGYANQFFYSLETNTVLSQNDRNAYDLLFDCDANSFYVWLNTAKFMSAIKTDKSNLDLVSLNDTIGKEWKYELGSFNKDSSALGSWWSLLGTEPVSDNKVYIIHLGLDANGESMGYIKLQIHNFSSGEYSVSYMREGENSSHNFTIPKDNTRNYAYFTFTNDSGIVDGIEPDKALWDFCFTRYSVVFYEPYYLPYLVTGVLHNPSRVQAYIDSTVNFETITISNFETNRLVNDRDAIGYGWKRFTNNDYTTLPGHVYFVKTAEDRFYKLHFVDFKQGNAWGYPAFEFYRL